LLVERGSGEFVPYRQAAAKLAGRTSPELNPAQDFEDQIP
jgi:hypothetical protein